MGFRGENIHIPSGTSMGFISFNESFWESTIYQVRIQMQGRHSPALKESMVYEGESHISIIIHCSNKN